MVSPQLSLLNLKLPKKKTINLKKLNHILFLVRFLFELTQVHVHVLKTHIH